MDSFGPKVALFAATALIVDYIMTVAVSISSSTEAMIATFPAIAGYKVIFSLVCLSAVTLINLRGIRESSKIFGIPTYVFIISMMTMIVTGFIELATGGISHITYSSNEVAFQGTMQSVSLFLILRAFSSGCSALTGVEAVSDAVPSFKEPSEKHAKAILYLLGGIIVFIFGGTSILASILQVMPIADATPISQMTSYIFGKNIMFYILQFSTSLILILAANTAYNGLPTLLSILAKDRYIPHQFSARGTKLSFSNGILFIFVVAGLLILLFQSDTHKLIPFYAVGVFVAFTLSQFGMFTKWIKLKQKGWRHKAGINGFGSLVTFVGLIVVFITKFTSGAWALVIIVPSLIYLMLRIKRHYDKTYKELEIEDFHAIYQESKSKDTNLCIVLLRTLNKAAVKNLNYANSLSTNVIALHITENEEKLDRLKEKWKSLDIDIPLKVLSAPYREIVPVIEKYIGKCEKEIPYGEKVTVIVTKFVEQHWYDKFLYNQTTYFILKKLEQYRNVVTVSVPYVYD